MGWFAVASIGGFLLFWVWHRPSSNGKAKSAWWPAVAFIALAIVLIVWAAAFTSATVLSDYIDVIGRGTVARALLGLVVGFGVAYAIEQRVLFAAPAQAGGDDAKPPAGVAGTSSVLLLGTGAVFLALAAPHVDNWLSHLNSLKSPVIELQLGSVATHKVSVTEGMDYLSDSTSLRVLSTYSKAIVKDIDYLENFESGDTKRIQATKELLPAFEYLVSPISGCVQSAVNNGMGIDHARNLIRPMADDIDAIIFGGASSGATQEHDDFWRRLQKLPEKLRPFLGAQADACLEAPKKYQHCIENPQTDKLCAEYVKKYPDGVSYPRFEDYKSLPYLHVAASYLFAFMNDEDLALRVLQQAENEKTATGGPLLSFKDYAFLQSAGRLSYYIGRPGPLEKSYFGYLDSMRTIALSRTASLEQSLAKCHDADCKKSINELLARHWGATLTATNDVTYYLAEDLARHSPYAYPYRGRAEEYVHWLDNAIADGTKTEAADKFYAIDADEKYFYVDTSAYMRMVLEARKVSPDVEVFKKAYNDLGKVVEHLENQTIRRNYVSKVQLTVVKTARSHLASARELSGGD